MYLTLVWQTVFYPALFGIVVLDDKLARSIFIFHIVEK